MSIIHSIHGTISSQRPELISEIRESGAKLTRDFTKRHETSVDFTVEGIGEIGDDLFNTVGEICDKYAFQLLGWVPPSQR